jgi:hypothetical protein
MPVTTGSMPAINDLAAELARQLSSTGNAARATMGDRAVAFGWMQGARVSASNLFASALVEGLTWKATRISLTGTPPVRVARGGVKPVAAQVASTTRTLVKFAGTAEAELEDIIDTQALVPTLGAVIVDGCMAAFDADIAAALEAAGGPAVAGLSWADAILQGIAAVPSASILVASAADYPAIVSPGAGYTLDPTTQVPVLFGLRVVIAPVTAGSAYVCDAGALMCAESTLTPLAVVDPFSRADVNVTRVVVDVLGDAYVTAPAGIAKATKTP